MKKNILKENFEKFSKIYYKRNEVPRKVRLNEQEDPTIKNDGWNKDFMDEIGLMDWLDTIEKLSYEIRGGRRGSYSKFGDTGWDLSQFLEGLKQDLEEVIDHLESRI